MTTGAGTTVSGSTNGIFAQNYGTGALTITANGDVTGTNGNGIYARNSGTGTALSVTSSAGTTVSGATLGIYAANDGTGALTVTANGDVTGTGTYGIFARNNSTGTTFSVTTGAGTTVSGGTSGILARNYGTGALSVTANGDVTSTTGLGIYARNFAGTDLSVTTGAGTTVSGGGFGISAINSGTGALTVTANGDVTGTSNRGINAYNFGAGTDLTVTTGAGTTVSGGTNGINARHYGTGALTIAANGDVTGTAGNGIDARNIGAGTTLTVTTGAGTTVSGTNGIFARHYGTGALTIAANGDVTATSGVGIDARNTGAGTTLTVTTGAGTTVSGANGIFAQNYGTGALTITANGNVTGTSNRGINAYSSGAGTNLTVTTGAGTAVSGGNIGIFADNQGTGALTITANGNVTGTNDNGIFAYNSGAGTNLSVTTAAGATVSGSTNGIFARTNGTGALAVTVAAAGTVSGTSGFGIQALGRPATVTVAGTVNGGASGAINFDQAGAFANRLELVTGAVINGNVLGGLGTDTLGLSGTGSGSFNVGQLSSFEAGEKTGSGSWTLTGTNAGIGTFAVSGGTLAVNGSLSNAAFTVSGGTLSGTGTVGNTLVSGGTFAPGSGTPGSSMTVSGTLGFNAAAAYAININPTTSSLANVSGVATLGGATVNANFATGSYIAKQYTILTAGSVSGTFNPTVANTNLPANFHDTLSYDATHAYLNLILSFTTPASGTLNGNQNNVANALINSFNSNGGIPLTFATLSAGSLSQASGESATGSQATTFNAMNQFMGLLTDPFIDGRGDGPGAGGTSTANGYASTQKPAARDAYAMFTKAASPSQPSPASGGGLGWGPRWSVWAAGYGGSQTSDGNAALGSNTATSRIAGTAVGADYRFSPFTIAGFALAGGGTSFAVNGMGSGRSDLFQAGAFVRHNVGPAYLTAALAYGWQDVTTDRTVTIAGIDRLRAEFKANAFSGRAEGGYRFVGPWIGGIGITPYAAGQFTTFELPAYAEQVLSGANTFALAYGAKSVTAPRSEIGVRTDKSWAMQNAILTLRGRLAWAYDYNTDRSIGATSQTLPGASFVVNGAAPSHNKALTTASAEVKWINGWSAAATFEGEFSDVSRSYAGKGVVRYQW
ncbi:autotransporter domain-containing protein [Bradyrhizobium sp. JYMT SZCCT0180]|nr:autotransporter domain-containing protein [Bradyrhizobium sp. JYMT SZCCT0180]